MYEPKLIDVLQSIYNSIPRVTITDKGDSWVNLSGSALA